MNQLEAEENTRINHLRLEAMRIHGQLRPSDAGTAIWLINRHDMDDLAGVGGHNGAASTLFNLPVAIVSYPTPLRLVIFRVVGEFDG